MQFSKLLSEKRVKKLTEGERGQFILRGRIGYGEDWVLIRLGDRVLCLGH